jgi:ATP-dependent DNA helicase PIF1
MQNIVKTVDVLPLLPSELDIVLLQPPESVVGRDPRYRRQFQADFRVRRGCVLAWLRFLKAHHPDYRYITISPARIEALPVDDDVSTSITTVFEEDLPSKEQPRQEETTLGPDAPLPLNQWSLTLPRGGRGCHTMRG